MWPFKKRFAMSTRELEGGITAICVQGNSDKDDDAGPQAKRILWDLVERGRRRILVNLSSAEWLTADFWGILLADARRLQASGGRICFAGVNSELREFLRELELSSSVELFPSEELAAASLRTLPASQTALEPRLSMECSQEGEAVRITLHGVLDERASEAFQRAFDDGFARGSRHYVLDCRDLSLISAEGTGDLIQAMDRVMEAGGKVSLEGLGGFPDRMIRIFGLDQVFDLR